MFEKINKLLSESKITDDIKKHLSELGISTENKTIGEILDELAEEWHDLK